MSIRSSAPGNLLPPLDPGTRGEAWDERAARASRERGSALELPGRRGSAPWSRCRVVLASVLSGRRLRLSCLARFAGEARDLQMAAVWMDSSGQQHAHRVPVRLQRSGSAWQEVGAEFCLPRGTRAVAFLVENPQPITLTLRDLCLSDHGPGLAVLDQPRGAAVLQASGAIGVRARAGGSARGLVVTPVPSSGSTQRPIHFEVAADPAESLRGCRWLPRLDAGNHLAELRLVVPEEGAVLTWRSSLFVPTPRSPVLPPVLEAESPPETQRWLRPTRSVPWTSPELRGAARALATELNDLEEYLRRVVAFSTEHLADADQVERACDARTAFLQGGSALGRAQLAVALLRAQGVPARTLASYPLVSGPLYQDWLVEAWYPGAGWIVLDTTRGILQPPSNRRVILAQVQPEDEDHALDPELRRAGHAPGTPRSTLPAFSPELIDARDLALEHRGGRWNELQCAMEIRPLLEPTVGRASRLQHDWLHRRMLLGMDPPDNQEAILQALRHRDAVALLAVLGTRRWRRTAT